MTEAMLFLQKTILLSYDPRPFGGVPEFIKKGHSPFLIKGLQTEKNFRPGIRPGRK